MPIIVLLIGLAFPLLELAVLIKVGQAIGLGQLILLLIGMAGLGAALLYWQGWSAMRQTREALLRGEPPVGPMLEGMMLVTAGVLLLVPGLISDVFALILLVPPLRRAIARSLVKRAMAGGRVHVNVHRSQEAQADTPAGGPVIDGEFERIDERPLDRGKRHDGDGAPR